MKKHFDTLRTMQLLMAVFIVGSAVPLLIMRSLAAFSLLNPNESGDLILDMGRETKDNSAMYKTYTSRIQFMTKKDMIVSTVVPMVNFCDGTCTVNVRIDDVIGLNMLNATRTMTNSIKDTVPSNDTYLDTFKMDAGGVRLVAGTIYYITVKAESTTAIGTYTTRDSISRDYENSWYDKTTSDLNPKIVQAQGVISLRMYGKTEVVTTCQDSDGGDKTDVKGSVTVYPSGVKNVVNDVCFRDSDMYDSARDGGDFNSVVEFVCRDNMQGMHITRCPYVCSNGACVSPQTVTNTKLKVEKVWITKDAKECQSFRNGVRMDCVNFRVWIDVRNKDGVKPAYLPYTLDVPVRLMQWNEREQRFMPEGLLTQYIYNGNPNEYYYGLEFSFNRDQFPVKRKMLVAMEQDGQIALKEFEAEFNSDLPVVGTAASSSSVSNSQNFSSMSIPLPYIPRSSKSYDVSSAFSCPELPPMPQTRAGCMMFKAIQSDGCYKWDEKCQSTSSFAPWPGMTDTPPAGYEEPVIVNENVEKSWFSDVSASDAVGAAANELATKGIVGGYPDGTFRPDQSVNRAEAAKFLVLAKYGDFGGEIANNGKFHDVLDGQWYTKYVMAAAILNVIAGNPDGSFRPGSPVNTAEFLKMLTLTFSLDLNLNYDYQDVNNDDWFSPYAGIAQQYDLFPDRGASLEPGRPMTRGEVVYAISRILSAQ